MTALPESRDLLRRHGPRCTPGRLQAVALFSASARHLSVAKVWGAEPTGPAVHPTTVYRTLETLTAVGLTHAVHGPGPTRYCIRGKPHHHVVCQDCGRVAALPHERLTEAVGSIEELTGLRPDASGSLMVYGRCAPCST